MIIWWRWSFWMKSYAWIRLSVNLSPKHALLGLTYRQSNKIVSPKNSNLFHVSTRAAAVNIGASVAWMGSTATLVVHPLLIAVSVIDFWAPSEIVCRQSFFCFSGGRNWHLGFPHVSFQWRATCFKQNIQIIRFIVHFTTTTLNIQREMHFANHSFLQLVFVYVELISCSLLFTRAFFTLESKFMLRDFSKSMTVFLTSVAPLINPELWCYMAASWRYVTQEIVTLKDSVVSWFDAFSWIPKGTQQKLNCYHVSSLIFSQNKNVHKMHGRCIASFWINCFSFENDSPNYTAIGHFRESQFLLFSPVKAHLWLKLHCYFFFFVNHQKGWAEKCFFFKGIQVCSRTLYLQFL